MSLQYAYTPIAFTTLNGTVDITATSSPGTTIISVSVPAASTQAINVEITDVDVYNPNAQTVFLYLQMFVSGFGLTSAVYMNLGHTSGAGLVAIPPNSGFFVGNIRWFLPQGAVVPLGSTTSTGGQTVDLTQGGTVGLAAYVVAAVT